VGLLYIDTEEGCPQWGHLSPLLSNIMLTEFDREFEKLIMSRIFFLQVLTLLGQK